MYVPVNIKPNSYNPETRTLIASFASEYPVKRYSWRNDEEYLEVLEMSEAAGDLSRINKGAPALRNHRAHEDPVGRTLRGWFEGKEALAEIQLSGREDLAGFRQDVEEGIICNMSFGYVVEEYVPQPSTDRTKIRTYLATKWTPHEVTFATVPADPTVGVRSLTPEEGDDKEEFYITTINEEEMTTTKTGAAVPPSTDPEEEGTRSLKPPVTPPTPVDAAKIAEEAGKAERTRGIEIREAVRTAKLDDSLAEGWINDGTPIDQVRKLVIEKWAAADPANGVRTESNAAVKTDQADKDILVRSTGLLVKGNYSDLTKLDPQLVKEANVYRHYSLLDMARMCLEDIGIRTIGMRSSEIAERAITESSSGFPVLLGNIVHQVLLNPRAIAADTWRETASIMSVSDFREHRFLRTWGLTNLDEIKENQEINNKPIADGTGEKISIGTYGNIINMSRRMIVNDELDAFARGAANMVRAYWRTIETKYYQRLLENGGFGPLMADGLPLFDAAHGNLNTAATMTAAELDKMRLTMGAQKDEGSLDFLDLRPSILLTTMTLEKTAKQYNEAKFDMDATGANKYAKPSVSEGLFEKIVASPRIAANSYYAFAKPEEEPTMVVAFLNGEQGPSVTRHEPWKQEGVEFKIIGDFGIGAVGTKGAVLNKGA